jgi:DNA-binding FrmR family transcriptional regulator
MPSHPHSHSHVHSPEEKRALQLRLRKIAGQIAAIEKMVGEDRDCPEVLMQVVSVRKALKSFAQIVIHEHAHQCIEGAAEPKEAQRKLRELLTVLERYVE